MKIKPHHRRKLEHYLKEFYKYYPEEKYTIFHFVRYLKQRLKKNKDAWHGVSGDPGTGKTYFTLMCLILFGRPASLVDNVTYMPTGTEIYDKFMKLVFNLFIVDEAAVEMRSVNWQSKQQQKVNVVAMTERFKNNAVFLNLPNFNEFTKSMRIGSLIFRIIVVYRTDTHARIILQRKSRNWRSDDPWGDKIANEKYDYIEKKQKKEITNDIILDIERTVPNTIMDFIIPNLELILPDITDEYQRLKTESRKNEDRKPTTKTSTYYKDKYTELMQKVSKILYYNELNIGKIKTTKIDIAGSLGVTVETLNRYIAMNNIKKKRPEFLQKPNS